MALVNNQKTKDHAYISLVVTGLFGKHAIFFSQPSAKSASSASFCATKRFHHMATGVFPMFQEEIHPSNFTYCIYIYTPKIAIYVKPESRPPNFQGGPHHFGIFPAVRWLRENHIFKWWSFPPAMLVFVGRIPSFNSQLNQLGHPHRSWWRLNAIWPQQQHVLAVKQQKCQGCQGQKSRFWGNRHPTFKLGIQQLMGAGQPLRPYPYNGAL